MQRKNGIYALFVKKTCLQTRFFVPLQRNLD